MPWEGVFMDVFILRAKGCSYQAFTHGRMRGTCVFWAAHVASSSGQIYCSAMLLESPSRPAFPLGAACDNDLLLVVIFFFLHSFLSFLEKVYVFPFFFNFSHYIFYFLFSSLALKLQIKYLNLYSSLDFFNFSFSYC